MLQQNPSTLARVVCVFAMCIAYHKTFTAPHYASEEETVNVGDWSDRWNKGSRAFTPLVKGVFWALGVAEILSCLTSNDALEPISSLSVIGLALAILGGWMRKRCYDTLSENFTFTMSLRKNHSLVTNGPYSIVRHPSYSAILLLYIGVGIWHASPSSWLRESGVLNSLPVAMFLFVYSASMMTTLVTLFIRAPREDRLLKKHFGREWDEWARNVPYMIIPGIV